MLSAEHRGTKRPTIIIILHIQLTFSKADIYIFDAGIDKGKRNDDSPPINEVTHADLKTLLLDERTSWRPCTASLSRGMNESMEKTWYRIVFRSENCVNVRAGTDEFS